MAKYDPMTEFSHNVSDAMQNGGWSQKALADVCGMKQPDVSNLLSCKSNPTLKTMNSIADALGLPLYQLLMPVRKPEKVA